VFHTELGHYLLQKNQEITQQSILAAREMVSKVRRARYENRHDVSLALMVCG
jgi:hypothetical protein